MVAFAALLSLDSIEGLSFEADLLADGVAASLSGAVILGEGDGLGLCLGPAKRNELPDVVLVKYSGLRDDRPGLVSSSSCPEEVAVLSGVLCTSYRPVHVVPVGYFVFPICTTYRVFLVGGI